MHWNFTEKLFLDLRNTFLNRKSTDRFFLRQRFLPCSEDLLLIAVDQHLMSSQHRNLGKMADLPRINTDDSPLLNFSKEVEYTF